MKRIITRFSVGMLLVVSMTGGLLAACGHHNCAVADELDTALVYRGSSGGGSSSGGRSSPGFSGSRSGGGSSTKSGGGSSGSSGTKSRGSNTKPPTVDGSRSSKGAGTKAPPSFTGSRSGGKFASPGAKYSGSGNISRKYSTTEPDGSTHVFVYHTHGYYSHMTGFPDPYDPYDYRNFSNISSPYYHHHMRVPC